MTSELTLFALRFAFLAVLWLFVFAVVFALGFLLVRIEVFGVGVFRCVVEFVVVIVVIVVQYFFI